MTPGARQVTAESRAKRRHLRKYGLDAKARRRLSAALCALADFQGPIEQAMHDARMRAIRSGGVVHVPAIVTTVAVSTVCDGLRMLVYGHDVEFV
jgi:hypothetical protein